MKLLVCFKILQDVDSVMRSDWEAAASGELDISYTQKMKIGRASCRERV